MSRNLGMITAAIILMTVASSSSAQDRTRPLRDGPRFVDIDWAQVQRDRNFALTSNTNLTVGPGQGGGFAIPTNNRAADAIRTRIPILLPLRGALGIEGAPYIALYPHEHFYSLVISGDNIEIEIFGSGMINAEAPDPGSIRRMRAAIERGFYVQATETGQEISFNRYGAAYSITVECTQPDTDTRCTNTDYLRNLAESLAYAAGSDGEGE